MTIFCIEARYVDGWRPVYVGIDWHFAYEAIENHKELDFVVRGSLWKDGKHQAYIDFGDQEAVV